MLDSIALKLPLPTKTAELVVTSRALETVVIASDCLEHDQTQFVLSLNGTVSPYLTTAVSTRRLRC